MLRKELFDKIAKGNKMSSIEFVSTDKNQTVVFSPELVEMLRNEYHDCYFGVLMRQCKSPIATSLTPHNLYLAYHILERGCYPGTHTVGIVDILPEPIEGEPKIEFDTFEEFCDFLGINVDEDEDANEDFLEYMGVFDETYYDNPDYYDEDDVDTTSYPDDDDVEDPEDLMFYSNVLGPDDH